MNNLTFDVINCAYEVHNNLGPGLLESIYQKALAVELKTKGFNIKCEVPIEVFYKGEKVGENLRVDILVNDTLILELKSVDKVTDLHKKQLLTYLRLTKKKIGLLINFNEMRLKEGITRIVNNYQETAQK